MERSIPNQQASTDEAGADKAAINEGRVALDSVQAAADGSDQVLSIGEDGVGGHCSPRQRPDVFHGVEIRRAGGQLDDGQPVVLGRVLADSGAAVNIQIVPDHHERAAELKVGSHEQVAVVLPGETPLSAQMVALDPPTVDESAALAGCL